MLPASATDDDDDDDNGGRDNDGIQCLVYTHRTMHLARYTYRGA